MQMSRPSQRTSQIVNVQASLFAVIWGKAVFRVFFPQTKHKYTLHMEQDQKL
jgi:hypothetical protein